MSPRTPAYQVITDGIRTQLTQAYGDKVYLHMEYLEIERYEDLTFPCELFELINQKYDRIDFNLLICVGVDIIRNVKSCASQKIQNLQTITIDYDLSDYGIPMDLSLKAENVVIGIKPNILATINSAFDLFPDRTDLHIICGTSPTDLLYSKITKTSISHLRKEVKKTFHQQLTMDDALRLVRNMPDNCIVFIPGFNTDSKKVYYSNPEAIRLISRSSKAPVYTISDMGFGEGSVGGYILSFRRTGLLAGSVAVKILSGFDPKLITVNINEYYDHIYDWRELKRWGLAGSKLIPKDSKIEYKETSFFERYKYIIIAVFLFLIMETILVLKLWQMNNNQRMITRKLIDAENKFRELVDEDRLLRLSELSASLSHELNQPLTAILSTAQAGIRFVDSNKLEPNLMKELYGNIVEDDKRAAAILSSLRGMMKLEKRKKEKVELNAIIEEILLIYQDDLIRNNIQLERVRPKAPVWIIADDIQIRQVLMNLITNAIQSVTETANKNRRITVKAEVIHDKVTVFISDTGKGIPDEIKNKIFRPLITTKQKGTGIGLSISRTIIENHQGIIWGENNQGTGATFAFSLETC